MASNTFQFKQFSIAHDRCAMKVGTDAVVLGALAGKNEPKSILEIGVGSGVVSLMLAQRFPEAKITGVEIDKEAWEQSVENANNSPWANRIEFLNVSFQDFCKSYIGSFDLIVSNPPYFPNHLKSPNAKRNLALHNDSLPFAALLNGTVSMMRPKSEFWVILPQEQMSQLDLLALSHGMKVSDGIVLRDNSEKNILRMIQNFSIENKSFFEKKLNIKDNFGKYSIEYSELLKEFLIIF